MTDTAELIAELLAEVRSDGDVIAGPSDLDRRAADAIASLTEQVEGLTRERDEQRVMFLYEADKHSEWLEKFMDMKRRAEVAEAEVSRLRAENEKMREALKPSAATKAAYIGEFTIAVERIVNDDEEPIDDGADAPDPYDHIQVPWTTIKEIMAAIRARAALESKD